MGRAILSVPAASGVLANDSDTQGGSLSAVLEVDAQHGNLVLAVDGSFTYLPEKDFFGTDSFSYRAISDARRSVPAVVTITVNSINDPPVAVDDEYVVTANTRFSTISAYANVVLESQPVGYWQLGEVAGSTTAVDLAGENNGQINNFVASDFQQPGAPLDNLDQSLRFDGFDNQVTVPHSPELEITGNLTIEFWMYRTGAVADWQRIVGKGTENVRTFGVWMETDDSNRIHFQQFHSRNDPIVGLYSNSTIQSDRWYFVAATVEGSSVKIYIDGTLDAQGSRLGVPTAETAPLIFGQIPGIHDFYSGRLDEVAIYNRALSAAEINRHYRAGADAENAPHDSVIDNDRDVDSDIFDAILVDDVQNGVLSLAEDGSFFYMPDEGFVGVDSFSYKASDGQSFSNVATVTIRVEGPPVAGDDEYEVEENQTLVVDAANGVLGNDSDANGDAITALPDSPPQHGSLSLSSDGSFTYTPDAGFSGIDTFTYRPTDGEHEGEPATVTIVVGTKIVDVTLVAVGQPSEEELLGELPVSLSEIAAGTSYFVEVWVQDIDEPGVGISGGTVDLGYNSAPADVTALAHGSLFDFLTTGQINDATGLVDDFGGGTFEAAIGIAPTWARLGYVEVSATAAGPVTFTLSEGQSSFSRSGLGNVPWSKVDLSSTLTVDQVGGLVQFDTTVVRQPTSLDAQGETKTLPKDAEYLHEWESYWVEVWVSTPDEAGIGVAGGTLDLAYDTSRFTATQIKYGAAFPEQTTGTIDDAAGVIRNLGGLTTQAGIGDADHALLARVRFEPTAADDAEVDEVGQSVGPYDLGLGLSNLQFPSVDTRISDMPETPLWAVLYDVDDNGLIDLGDFSRFAPAFGETVDGGAPIAWWADFDTSGLVDFGDFSFFVANVNRGKPDGEVTFPESYPDAWLPGQRAEPPVAAAGTPIRVELVAVPTPSLAERLAALPGTLTEVASGATFYIEVWLRDLYHDAQGITGGMVDMLFDSSTSSAIDVENSDQFGVFSDGQIKSAEGRIDRLGGGTFSSGIGAEDEWARLATVQYTATTDGQIDFSLGEGDLRLSRFNLGNVSWDDVELGSLTLNASPVSPADLTGNGFVDFQDLTILLANWNQSVSAAEGNLVNAGTSPVNFQDLTVLLAAWTGPGGAASPPAAEVAPQDAGQETSTTESRAATIDHFDQLGRRERAISRRAYRRNATSNSNRTPLRRLQASAVDRAIGEESSSDPVTIVRRRTSSIARR
jgi:VCBS repeat-containing protein